MNAVLPKPTREDRLRAIRRAIGEAHRFGVTSIQNASGSRRNSSSTTRSGTPDELQLRVYSALGIEPASPRPMRTRSMPSGSRYPDDPLFKTGAVKLMADGVIEAHTAAMLEAVREQGRRGPAQLHGRGAEPDRRARWTSAAGRLSFTPSAMAASAWRSTRSSMRPRRTRPPRAGAATASSTSRRSTPPTSRDSASLGVIASQQPFHAQAEPEPDRRVGWQHRARSRLARLGLEAASRTAAGAWLRQRLACGILDPAHRPAHGGEPHDGGGTAGRRLAARAEAAAAGGDRRLHAWRRLCVVRRAAQGIAGAGNARGYRHSVDRHLQRAAEAALDAVVEITIFDGKVVFTSRGPAHDHVELTASGPIQQVRS